jgi:putative ABC transport system substrate-binding protein
MRGRFASQLGATDTAQVLLRATNSIPIVFAGLVDPVGAGLIASYARPGGNAAGTSRTGAGSLGPKLLESVATASRRCACGCGV